MKIYRKASSRGAYLDMILVKCFWRASTWFHNNRYYTLILWNQVDILQKHFKKDHVHVRLWTRLYGIELNWPELNGCVVRGAPVQWRFQAGRSCPPPSLKSTMFLFCIPFCIRVLQNKGPAPTVFKGTSRGSSLSSDVRYALYPSAPLPPYFKIPDPPLPHPFEISQFKVTLLVEFFEQLDRGGSVLFLIPRMSTKSKWGHDLEV